MDATVVQPFDREQIIAGLTAWADALRERNASLARCEALLGQRPSESDDLVRWCRGAIDAWRVRQDLWTVCDRAEGALATMAARLGCELGLTAADLSLALQLVALAGEAPQTLLSDRIDALADPAIDAVLTELDLRVRRASDTQDEAARVARGRPFWDEDPSTLLEAARVLQTAGIFGFLSADVRRARSLSARILPSSSNAAAADGLRKLAGAIAARRAATELRRGRQAPGVGVSGRADGYDAVA